MTIVPTKFLIRPPALIGESLSSWRQRVSWANGYRLFPISQGSLRRVDPDLGIVGRDITWVAALHDSTDSRCREMTLSGHVGRVVDHIDPHNKPHWWLRCRREAAIGHHGSMFCPLCLATDPDPYFRLAWRCAFSTVCPKHHSLLTDRCPQCGQPPWPSVCRAAGQVSRHFTSFALCPYCDFNLSCMEIRDLASPTQVDIVMSNPEMLTRLFRVSPLEALMAIRSICQLFVHPGSQRRILNSGTRWATIAQSVLEKESQAQSIDDASVGVRHMLVTVAIDICKEWPQSFLKFARNTGISRTHFNGSIKSQPAWMNNAIDEILVQARS